jgi:triosephosphate isomerase
MVGAQNCHQHTHGAFTGEISAAQLKDLGCQYVILGHSERRMHAHETDDEINEKAEQAINHGITPIICMGETYEARKEHRFKQALLSQLDKSTAGLNKSKYVIAYEPIWSIGTGLVPTNEEILEVFYLIHHRLNSNTPIIYGGSVTDKNAATLRTIQSLKGVLVGGASLNVHTFQAIVDAFQS